LSAAGINTLPTKQRQTWLECLTADEAEFLQRDWAFWARPEQLAPDGDWRIWLFLGGRGAGKTRAGSEWILHGIRTGRMRRVALLGATDAGVRDVMILGDCGLLTLAKDEGVVFEPSKRQLVWPNGAIAHGFTAAEPDGLRGHPHDGA
jgi:phage terminase large subunit-like protein